MWPKLYATANPAAYLGCLPCLAETPPEKLFNYLLLPVLEIFPLPTVCCYPSALSSLLPFQSHTFCYFSFQKVNVKLLPRLRPVTYGIVSQGS